MINFSFTEPWAFFTTRKDFDGNKLAAPATTPNFTESSFANHFDQLNLTGYRPLHQQRKTSCSKNIQRWRENGSIKRVSRCNVWNDLFTYLILNRMWSFQWCLELCCHWELDRIPNLRTEWNDAYQCHVYGAAHTNSSTIWSYKVAMCHQILWRLVAMLSTPNRNCLLENNQMHFRSIEQKLRLLIGPIDLLAANFICNVLDWRSKIGMEFNFVVEWQVIEHKWLFHASEWFEMEKFGWK